jgi:hypothetical protein
MLKALHEFFEFITSSTFVMSGLYVFLAIVAWRFAIRLNAKDNNWRFEDLLTDHNTGKASLGHVMQAVGSITLTWGFVFFTVQKSLTDAYVGIYAAYCAGVYGIQKFSTPTAPTPPQPPTGAKV